MRKFLVVLLVVVVAGAALWQVQRQRQQQLAGALAEEDAGPVYDFEARDVTVRQMGADGRLQYELEAARLTQSANGGEVVAEQLTLHHDPAGTIPGGQHRWTLTAENARLPAEGQLMSMHGDVRISGLPRGRRTPVRIFSEQLDYDIGAQEVSSAADVKIEWGGIRSESRGFSFNIDTGNIATGEQRLQSSHATPAP